MSPVKPSRGTRPLDRLRDLTAKHRRRLQAYAITTLDELVALSEVREGLNALAQILDLSPERVAALVRKARRQMPRARTVKGAQALRMAQERMWAGGGVPPDGQEMAHTRARPRYDSIAFAPGTPDHVNLSSLLGPPRDQGQRGTCVAHAVAAVREALEVQAGAEVPPDLSEQFIYWWAKQHDGLPPEATPYGGTLVRVGARCLVDVGAPPEEAWPYNPVPTPGPDPQGPPPKGIEELARRYRARRAIGLNPNDPAAIRNAVADGKPVAISFYIYNSWYLSRTVHQYGKITMPFPLEQPQGGHAVVVVGYQDDPEYPGGGYFIIRNSWTLWGYESPFGPGYGTLPYAYMALHGLEAYTLDRYPQADVYVRDHEEDTGDVPTETCWASPDIWVRLQPDGGEEHQIPTGGGEHALYARVHNRGPADAYDVEVRFFTAPLSPVVWPNRWAEVGRVVVPHIPAGEAMVAGPVLWHPEHPGDAAYLVRVASTEDPVQHEWDVAYDNNIAQRVVTTVAISPGEEREARFWLTGPRPEPTEVEVAVDMTGLPAGAQVMWPQAPDDESATYTVLKAGKTPPAFLWKLADEQQEVLLRLRLSPETPAGTFSLTASVRYGQRLVGRLTWRVEVPA